MFLESDSRVSVKTWSKTASLRSTWNIIISWCTAHSGKSRLTGWLVYENWAGSFSLSRLTRWSIAWWRQLLYSMLRLLCVKFAEWFCRGNLWNTGDVWVYIHTSSLAKYSQESGTGCVHSVAHELCWYLLTDTVSRVSVWCIQEQSSRYDTDAPCFRVSCLVSQVLWRTGEINQLIETAAEQVCQLSLLFGFRWSLMILLEGIGLDD